MSCATVPTTRPTGSLRITGAITRDGAPARGYVRLLDANREFVAELPTDREGAFTFFAAPGEWTVRLIGADTSTDVPVTLVDADADPLSIAV